VAGHRGSAAAAQCPDRTGRGATAQAGARHGGAGAVVAVEAGAWCATRAWRHGGFRGTTTDRRRKRTKKKVGLLFKSLNFRRLCQRPPKIKLFSTAVSVAAEK
jgi:hypothetical protein